MKSTRSRKNLAIIFSKYYQAGFTLYVVHSSFPFQPFTLKFKSCTVNSKCQSQWLIWKKLLWWKTIELPLENFMFLKPLYEPLKLRLYQLIVLRQKHFSRDLIVELLNSNPFIPPVLELSRHWQWACGQRPTDWRPDSPCLYTQSSEDGDITALGYHLKEGTRLGFSGFHCQRLVKKDWVTIILKDNKPPSWPTPETGIRGDANTCLNSDTTDQRAKTDLLKGLGLVMGG